MGEDEWVLKKDLRRKRLTRIYNYKSHLKNGLYLLERNEITGFLG
jgi:hypothetical protein